MTDREQIRRDATEVIYHGAHVHEDLPAEVAEHCLALLAELEQVERERDEANRMFQTSCNDVTRQAARLAQAEKLAEALREIADEYDGYLGTGQMLREKCLEALADWERKGDG